MNSLLYEEWCQRRLNKIFGIFGKEWFAGKSILELGCGDANIGIELLKLGSNVVFTDARKEHILKLGERLKPYSYEPECAIIDQNLDYDFGRKFDMVINFGVLYHLQNWKNDLRCALNHTNLMLLESSIWPVKDLKSHEKYCGQRSSYESVNDYVTRLSQDDVEQELTNLGCKFLRIDDPSLNVNCSWDKTNHLIRFIYDWTYEKYENGTYQYFGNHEYDVHYKRFWIVIK